MLHIHKYRIVDVEHCRYIRSQVPATHVSKVCRCGKPKFVELEGHFTAEQLRGKR